MAEQGILGLQIPNEHIKLLAYTDDVDVVISCELQIKLALEKMSEFGRATEAEVNFGKTMETWLGNWACTPVAPLGETCSAKLE